MQQGSGCSEDAAGGDAFDNPVKGKRFPKSTFTWQWIPAGFLHSPDVAARAGPHGEQCLHEAEAPAAAGDS